jgi:hypothetical protein
MEVPEFQKAYRDTRRAAFGQSIARFQQASTAAVSMLLKIIIDPASSPSTRVRATDSVFDHAKQAIESASLHLIEKADPGHGRYFALSPGLFHVSSSAEI